MRLLIVNDNTTDQINGVVTTYSHITDIMRTKGIIIKQIDPSHFKNIRGIFYPDYSLPINPWRLGRLIEDFNPTHVHIATEGVLGIFAKRYFKKRGWNYTSSYHTRWDIFIEKILGFKLPVSYMIKRFHRDSSAILAPSYLCAKMLHDMGLTRAVPWSRGVDKTKFKFSDRSNRQGKPVLLNVGRVSPEKGLDDFCSLDKNKYDLVLVGDGPDLDRLKQKYPYVKFLGALTGEALYKAYQDSDCFVFPSKSDTFGIVMIESMAVGTPVAAYPVDGPIAVIDHGITGFLSRNLSEAVEVCLSLNRQIVCDHSSKWDWSKVTEEFIQHLVHINQ